MKALLLIKELICRLFLRKQDSGHTGTLNTQRENKYRKSQRRKSYLVVGIFPFFVPISFSEDETSDPLNSPRLPLGEHNRLEL